MKKYKLITAAGAMLLTMNMAVPAFADEIEQEEGTTQLVAAVENVQTFADDIDPIDPTVPIDPVDPIDPTEPVDPIDPVEPVDPVEPTDPSEPTDPTEPTEPDPVDPTEPTEPVNPVDPTEPSEPVKPTEPTKPAEPTTPTKPVEPGNPTIPEQPSAPINTVPSPQQPIQTAGGQTIIGVDNGNPIIQEVDGTTKTVTPESIGATKQKDGSLSVKTKNGTKVLPHTGEKNQAAVSVFGFLISALSLVFLRKKSSV
jgi:LPXTG-motif cell wall-anchored protein